MGMLNLASDERKEDMVVSTSRADSQEPIFSCFLVPLDPDGDDSSAMIEYHDDSQGVLLNTVKPLESPSSLEDLVHVLRTCACHEAIQVQSSMPSAADNTSTPDTSFSLHSFLPEESRFTINILLTIVPGDSFAISLQAASEAEAVACLEFVTSLPDDCFCKVQISHGPFHDKLRHQPPLFDCPFSLPILAKLLSHGPREIEFSFYSFDPEQTGLLLSHTTMYRLKLSHCQLDLPDDMEVIQGRGPIRLTLCFGDALASYGQVLFRNSEDWLTFLGILDTDRLEVLNFCEGLVETSVCQLLGTLPLRHLELRHVKLSDGGASLIQSVKQGVGPRGLALLSPLYMARRIFREPYHWSTFFAHLRGSRNLERLVLDGNTLHQADWWTLADALKENSGLKQLRISYGLRITSECWTELMKAIAHHPSLERLFFEIIVTTPGWNDPASILHRTESLASLVRNNRRIYDIGYSYSFDRLAWNEKVAPELEYNRFLRRYTHLQEMDDPTRRASIIGASLKAVNKDPRLLWLALSMNQDVLSQHAY